MLETVLAVCALSILCLTATGCSLQFFASPDELYSLPQLPEQYTELEDKINALLENGAEYAAPISGTNIQPVQLVDLNGDGSEEALAFLRNSADEKPLKIYIFSPHDHTYQQAAVIEGSGTAIYSVRYADLDQDGKMELVIGWKVGTELQALTVYSLRNGEPEELMRTNYVKYAVASLDGDKTQEIVVLRSDDEGNGIADYYTWEKDGTLTLSSTARLSITMAELNSGRVSTGKLKNGSKALFVTGVSDTGMAITDILTVKGGDLTNVVLSDVTGVSTEIYRYLSLFPTDINGDGVTEVPAPVSLPTRGNTANLCYRIDWHSYDDTGAGEIVESTYHDIDDGWYLTLPDAWSGKILVTRSQSGIDEMAVTFSVRGDLETEPQDFLRIYTITGNSREVKAVRGNRFILSRQPGTIYAAELLEENQNWEYGITEDELHACFNLITTEWLAGDG
jgi:hypothetical protein